VIKGAEAIKTLRAFTRKIPSLFPVYVKEERPAVPGRIDAVISLGTVSTPAFSSLRAP